ncbi:MAG: TolC family protein [Bacteroidia bacterium]
MIRLDWGRLLFFFVDFLYAQDTLKVTLRQADSLFLATSYYLLAASMNIEAQKAKILQAKLYPNPIFTVDLNAYDPQGEKFFRVGPTGQKIFRIEQLILLGGKRKTEIEMAKTQARIAELEFELLVRRLKFQLHKNLFGLGQLNILLWHYGQQLALLDTLIRSYQVQVEKGHIPLKELVRLKSAYLRLVSQRAPLWAQYHQFLQTVQTLLQTDAVINFVFTDEEIRRYIKPYSLEELQAQALQHRLDFLILKENWLLAQQFFLYQRQLAIPDATLFAYYDQAGAAFRNQISAGVFFSLPFWNRNQGNIKASYFKMKEADYQLKTKENEIRVELQNKYQLYLRNLSEYNKAMQLYGDDFQVIMRGVVENFQKRNISLMEFMDFFESYNQALGEMARIKSQLVELAEELNLLTGKDLY